jgi:hypothetical protein
LAVLVVLEIGILASQERKDIWNLDINITNLQITQSPNPDYPITKYPFYKRNLSN